jgi:DnaJ like chaperone protein
MSSYAQKLVHYDFYLKKQVIQQLIFMASIDGYTHLKESLIFNAGKTLGFHHSQIRRYIDDVLGIKQEPPRDTNSYKILGCKSTDDNTAIKKKYRELVKKYHPDFIQSKGQDESFVEFAKQKMQEINNAYDAIKKERGI